MQRDLAEFIASSYEVAAAEGDFGPLMSRMAKIMNASVVLFTANLRLTSDWRSGKASQNGDAFTWGMVPTEPRTAELTDIVMVEAALSRNNVLAKQHMSKDISLVETPFYEEILRGSTEHAAVLLRGKDRSSLSYHCMVRPPGDRPFSAQELLDFRFISENLSRASGLRTQLAAASHASAGDDRLDLIPHAVLLMTGDGRVVRANRAAVDMAAGGELVLDRIGQVSLVSNDGLKPGISALGSLGGIDTYSIVRGEGVAPSGATAILTAAPESWANGVDDLFTLVVPARNIAIPPGWLLKRQYGLTDSEVRFVESFVTHKSIERSAADIDVKIDTARKYSKLVFEKVGVHSQAELMHLLLSHPYTLHA